MKIITATQARKISDSKTKSNLDRIMKKIEKAASEGELKVNVDQPLTPFDIKKLVELGFTISNVTSKNNEPREIIKW